MNNMLTRVPIAVLLFAACAFADESVPTKGTMRVVPKKGDDPTARIELALKHTEVQAEISGFVTRVKVVQTFSNPCTEPIEAVYVFPLPQNAAVNDLTIRIADRVVKGVIKKRDEARQIYEAARDAGKTAALLEQERPNIFSQSVANIMPGSDILVEITYDEVLAYDKGGYEFVFPMVVGPRFIPGSPTGKSAGGWSPDTDKVPDAAKITPPVLKPGERNGHDINVTVRLNAGFAIRSLESPSHRTVITGQQEETGAYSGPVEIRLKPSDTIPNKDFVLRYKVAGAKPEMALLTHKSDLGGYFLLMFQPPESPAPETVTPKEMVFVMDTSGSMSGEPIALSKKAVRYALDNLNSNDTFQIIRFSESASPFAEKPLLATPENIRRGKSYINGLEGEGGTMMIEGIKAALDYPHAQNRLRIVCFMTDGYIGNEAEILAAIQQKIGDDTRLFSFGVGSSVNRYLLDNMAKVGRGEVQYVLLNEKPDEAVNKFYERVRNPVLTHIRVDWASLAVEDLYPAQIRDLFAGQPIFVQGRYTVGGKAEIRIHGRVNGEEQTYTLRVELPDANPDNASLAPLWARARIADLSSEQFGGPNADVILDITQLALKYRLMSEYTSFVAVEEKVVNTNGRPTTIQVPVEMPEGVSYEGVFGHDREDRSQGFANAPCAAVSGAPLVMKGLFCGRSGGGRMKSYSSADTVCCEIAVEEDKQEAVSEPLKPFAIELKTADRIVRIATTGEIWIERSAAGEKIMAGRLTQEQTRELWKRLATAMNENLSALSWTGPGTLTVHVLDDKGAISRTTSLQLGGKDAPESETWKQVVEYVENLVR